MAGGDKPLEHAEIKMFGLFCLMMFLAVALTYLIIDQVHGSFGVVAGLTLTIVCLSLATHFFLDAMLHPLTDELEESETMKREFISIISHQLRTPLTSIRLFSEMLESEMTLEDKEPREFVRNIRLSSEKMVHLVNELLNLSRIEAGHLTIDPRPTDLALFTQDLLVELQPLAALRHCKLVYKTPRHRLSLIPLDHELVHHVLSNILENAIKYSGNDQNAVTVTIDRVLEEGKPFARVSVKDEGIGIPPDDQHRVYDKFFRGSNATHVLTEGTGLGLYLSKVILDSSGGRIWFRSKEGKGTTFYVAFPLEGMQSTHSL